MAKAKAENTEVNIEPTCEEQEVYFDLDKLYEMKFRDKDGTVTMIRKAYGGNPKGRLEFYHPES